MIPNKEAIKLLVDALRSDEYEQGVTYLHCGTQFCFWGVACQVYQKQHLPRQQLSVSHGRSSVMLYDFCTSSAPDRVQEWLGISHEHEFNVPGVNPRAVFYTLNDVARFPFNKFADLLEKEFLQPPPTPPEA